MGGKRVPSDGAIPIPEKKYKAGGSKISRVLGSELAAEMFGIAPPALKEMRRVILSQVINSEVGAAAGIGSVDGDCLQSHFVRWASGTTAPLSITASEFVSIIESYKLPVDLAITMARLESQIGTQGKGARTNNMFNVGNDDAGNTVSHPHQRAGVEAYCKLMVKHYFTPEEIAAGAKAEQFIARRSARPASPRLFYCPMPDYAAKLTNILGSVRSAMAQCQQQSTADPVFGNGAGNMVLAEAAWKALRTSSITDGGKCQAWAGSVVRSVYRGIPSYGSAAEAGRAWRRDRPRCVVPCRTWDCILPGDVLFKLTGSRGNGHVGIAIPGRRIAENTTKSPRLTTFVNGACGYTPFENWGQFDVVVRLPPPPGKCW